MVGRLRNNNYTEADGREVYGMTFTCEELDYLDSKAESDARRERQDEPSSDAAVSRTSPKPRTRTGRSGGQGRGAAAAN